MERVTHLGSDIHVSTSCEPEVNRRLGWACGVIHSLYYGVLCCRYLGMQEESPSRQVIGASSLALRM